MGLFNECPHCTVDGDFCLPNEINSWNFQHMLLYWFLEASQNLSSFRQLLFSLFHRGTKGKNSKSLPRLSIVFDLVLLIHFYILTWWEKKILLNLSLFYAIFIFICFKYFFLFTAFHFGQTPMGKTWQQMQMVSFSTRLL